MLLPIRRTFDQYVNVRPAILYEGIESPLKGKKPGDIDMWEAATTRQMGDEVMRAIQVLRGQ
ncbi:MAG: hypothetical protein ACRERE_28020 [Candidatus Entotheonellia bacterium]